MAANRIVIDKEFAALCRKLKPEERSKLETSIDEEGCRDPLVIWAGHDILLDGHNRYEICQSLGVEFQTVEIVLGNRDQAHDWIIDNQLGKRNLSDEERSYLRGKRYQNEKKKHGGDRKSEGSSDNGSHLKTSEQLATQYKVHPTTIRNDAKFAEAVDAIAEVAPEVKQEILSGESRATRVAIGAVATLPKDQRKAAAQELVKSAGKKKPVIRSPKSADDHFDMSAFLKRVDEVLSRLVEKCPTDCRPALAKRLRDAAKSISA